MRVGVPREIKADEHRVALTPSGVRELVARGHDVYVETGAGEGAAVADSSYVSQGAGIVPDAEALFERAELLVKVKEPQPDEVARLEPGHTLFTYLHLAPNRPLTELLLDSGATCIAYETVEDGHGRLPLLMPMSEIAGKLAAQAGALLLEKHAGGPGLLMSGTGGVPPARVMVLGGGVVGYHAAQVALGLGGQVYVYDLDLFRLRELEGLLRGRAVLCHASPLEVEERLANIDLVIGAVLVRGARAPCVIRRDQLGLLAGGAVLVDVSIDQGGCFETSRPTTHSEPTFEVDGVLHYCVANMPGAVPVTATRALANATLPYVLALADAGAHRALADDPGFLRGLNVVAGAVTHAPVATEQGHSYVEPDDALGLLAR